MLLYWLLIVPLLCYWKQMLQRLKQYQISHIPRRQRIWEQMLQRAEQCWVSHLPRQRIFYNHLLFLDYSLVVLDFRNISNTDFPMSAQDLHISMKLHHVMRFDSTNNFRLSAHSLFCRVASLGYYLIHLRLKICGNFHPSGFRFLTFHPRSCLLGSTSPTSPRFKQRIMPLSCPLTGYWE